MKGILYLIICFHSQNTAMFGKSKSRYKINLLFWISDRIHFNHKQPYRSFNTTVWSNSRCRRYCIIDVSTAIRAKLRKPGACGVLSLQVKYDPASRSKCNATLIIDDIQYSRKSCPDRYEFRTVPFTISCCNLQITFLSTEIITHKVAIFQTQQTDSSTTPPWDQIQFAPKIWGFTWPAPTP
jgi:hypothetical protein